MEQKATTTAATEPNKVVDIHASKKPKFLTADDILGKDDRDYVEVECPEWGGTVRVRSLTGAEAVVFANSLKSEKGRAQAMIRIIAMCACDENGKRIFTPEQVEMLASRNLRACMRVKDAAMRHNGYTTEGEADAAEVDPMKSGSETTGPEGSLIA